MLNIINLLKKKQIVVDCNNKGESTRVEIRNVPASKEWFNSVYSFNKNTIRFLPAIHSYVFKFLKGYFNTLIKNSEKKRTKKARRIYRFSTEKIWVSTPEIKHFAEKLYITVYVYNRIYNVYKKKLNLLEFDVGPTVVLANYKQIRKIKKSIKRINVSPKKKVIIKTNNNIKSNPIIKNIPASTLQEKHTIIAKGLYNISKINAKENTHVNSLRYINTHNKTNEFFNLKYLANNTSKIIIVKKPKLVRTLNPIYVERKRYYCNYIDMIRWLKLDKLTVMNQYKSNLLNSLTNKEWKNQLENLKAQRHNYLINQFRKELVYIKLKQKMLFNQFKFNELYMTPIIEFLQTLYKKKVIVNIVALKHHYLNSSILSQIIVTKTKNPKYRGRSLKVVDASTSRIRIPVLSNTKLPRVENKYTSMQNVILDNFETKNEKSDYLEQFLLAKKAKSDRTVHKSVLKNLENKVIAGIFIKISGRLTKRYKAQRAVSRLRSKGTLKNVYSAHKGFSSKLSRGFSNINVEKTMIHSNTRIGAYGLTGWIASY